MKNFSLYFIAFVLLLGGMYSALAKSNSEKIVEQIMKLEAEYTEASKILSAEIADPFFLYGGLYGDCANSSATRQPSRKISPLERPEF